MESDIEADPRCRRLTPEEVLAMTSQTGALTVPPQYWGKVTLEEDPDIHTYFPYNLLGVASADSSVSKRVLFLQSFLEALLDMPGVKPEINPTTSDAANAPRGKSVQGSCAARKRKTLKCSETWIENREEDSTEETPQSAFQKSISLLPPVPRTTGTYNLHKEFTERGACD